MYLSTAGGTLLGTVFLVAALGKLSSRAAMRDFAGSLRRLRLIPAPVVTPVAVVLALVEAAVPVLLVAPGTATVGFAVALSLLTVLTAGIAVALARGTSAPCRCFGRRESPLTSRHLLRNGLLAAAAVTGLIGLIGHTGPAGGGTAPGGALVAALAGLTAAVLIISFDDLADLFTAVPPNHTTTKDLR